MCRCSSRSAGAGGGSLASKPARWCCLLPFYLALYIVYPSSQGTRYLMPLLPLLAVCVWRLICLAPAERRNRLLGTLVGLHLCVALGGSIRESVQLYSERARWGEVDALLAVVERDPRPVMACGAPEGTWEMAQVASNRPVEWTKDPERLARHAGWVISAADYDPGPGFVETARAGELKLIRADRAAVKELFDPDNLNVTSRHDSTTR